MADAGTGVVDVFKPQPTQPTVAYESDTNPTATSATLNATVDPNGGGDITSCEFQSAPRPKRPKANSVSTRALRPRSLGHAVLGADRSPRRLRRPDHRARPTTTGSSSATRTRPAGGADRTYHPARRDRAPGRARDRGDRHRPRPSTAPSSATAPTPTTTSNGARPPPTATRPRCRRESTPARPPARPGPRLGRRSPGSNRSPRYHYRIVADNGAVSNSEDLSFTHAAAAPGRQGARSATCTPNAVVFHARVNPGGADTTYRFRVRDRATAPIVPDPCTRGRPARTPHRLEFQVNSRQQPARRPQAGDDLPLPRGGDNSPAPRSAPTGTFTTFPFSTGTERLLPQRPRPPADRRRAAPRLPRLRARLGRQRRRLRRRVRPGRRPDPVRRLPAAPRTPPRSSTASTTAASPGTGNPTNRGVDPYVATRGDRRLDDQLRRHPRRRPLADGPSPRPSPKPTPASTPSPSAAPKSARPASPTASHRRSRSACRTAASSRAWPARSRSPAPNPAGFVGKHLSADGTHFVFGSTAKFEPDGNGNGDVSIYDRDLERRRRPTSSPKTPAGGDDDRRRASPSSTSPRTARGSWSASWSPPTRPATATGTST